MQTQPNKLKELWVGVAKNKRLPILNSEKIRTAAGIKIGAHVARVDNFLIENDADPNVMEPFPMALRGIEMKSKMAIKELAEGRIDCAIVGRDTAKEFNLASRAQAGLMQAVELLDMDLARCAFTVAVRGNDTATKPTDLNGRTIVTEYPEMLKSWARMKNVRFAKIISGSDIQGGIEGYPLLNPTVTVIADLVQSGESLVNNGWKPLGMKDNDWLMIMNDRDRKFIDFTSEKLKSIPGVVMESSAVLVRNDRVMTDEKELALELLQKRLEIGAIAYGVNPTPRRQYVRSQWGQPSRRLPKDIFRPSPRQAAALGLS